MSFTKVVSDYHDSLVRALLPLRGQEVTPAAVRAALVDALPELEAKQKWVMPSDHCRNHSNKGACRCALTDEALFERLGRGRYRVL